MSTHIFHRVAGDTGTPIAFELVDRDITGWTIKLLARYRDTFRELEIDHVADDASKGIGHFDFASSDLVRGFADFEIDFLPPDAKRFTVPGENTLLLKVRGKGEPGPGVIQGGPETATFEGADMTIKVFGGGGSGGGGGGIGGSGTLGPPTDGTYLDGAIPLTNDTKIADAIDSLNEFVGQIAAKAGELVGQNLTVDVTTYAGKLPSGLSPAWGIYTPGDLINNLILAGSYVVTSPDTANRFRAGVASDPSTAGVLTHVLDGTDADEHDIGADGVGSTGALEVFALDTFNGIWLKANARINFSQGEGRKQHELRHTEAGLSNALALYRDDLNDTPSFSVPPGHAVSVELTRFLSGVEYYREGTVFGVTYTAAAGIFRKAYHPTSVSSVSVPSATTVDENPASPPAVNDTFPVSTSIALSASNVAQGNNGSPPNISVTLRKPDGTQAVGTSALARGINTYSAGASTPTVDQFVDELERLQLGTATPWVSSAALVDGNAQVRNGVLVHGADGDYGAHVATAEYERLITPGVQSGGTFRLTGVAASQIAQFGTGQLNALLLLETDGLWFDLGLAVGLNNGTGDGSTPANSKGAKISASGGDLVFSFGVYSTGSNNNQYRAKLRLLGANALAIGSIQGL